MRQYFKSDKKKREEAKRKKKEEKRLKRLTRKEEGPSEELPVDPVGPVDSPDAGPPA